MEGAETAGGIAGRRGRPAPTVRGVVSRVGGAGLVARIGNPADLRCFHLHLTPQGEATRARTRETGQAIVASHFGHLPPQRIQAALNAMQALHDALSAPTSIPEEVHV